MNARANNRWNRPVAVAVALPYSPMFEVIPMRDRLAVLRDTIIVLGMQIAFRAALWMRRLNY
jgi:hypothetical protein